MANRKYVKKQVLRRIIPHAEVKRRNLAMEEVTKEYSLRNNAREIIHLFELKRGSNASRRILRLGLQQIFLSTVRHKTIAEEKYAMLAGQLAKLEYAIYKYPEKYVSLGEGVNVYQGALNIMKFLKANKKEYNTEYFSGTEKYLEKTLESIKRGPNKEGRVGISPVFFAPITAAGTNFARSLVAEFDKKTKIAFRAISKISAENALYDAQLYGSARKRRN